MPVMTQDVDTWPVYHVTMQKDFREWFTDVTKKPIWHSYEDAMWIRAESAKSAEWVARHFAQMEGEIVVWLDIADASPGTLGL
jgi:hypothetical protein